MLWSLIQKKLHDHLPLPFVSWHYVIMFFCLRFHAWNLLCVTSQQKQVSKVSLVLKDSDTESENHSSLIQLSVSDGQKTEGSKVVSFIGR